MINKDTLQEWIANARRDDWHSLFVGSDIRIMLGEIERNAAKIETDAKVIAALREALTEVITSTRIKASARAKPETYFSPRMEQAFAAADRILVTAYEQTAGK